MADMTSTTIQTERLNLQPFTPREADELHALWIQPEVRRYLWDDEVIPSTQTAEILRCSEELFATEGFGLWSIRREAGSRLLGFGGYWHFRDPPELELILGLGPDCWRRGFATEAGIALMRFGFGALGFQQIRGSTDAPNVRSLRLMERLGMTYERRAVVGGLDTLFYVARQRDWPFGRISSGKPV
jgi:ribosomal-protein-alanine N-acetyltransferase